MMVVTSCGLLLACHREVADAFHVTDDTCQIVDVAAMTLRTLFEIVLADVAALVADCVRNVECEVVTSFLCCHAKQLSVLCLRQMLFKIEVQGRTTCEVLDVLSAMQAHLVDDVQ